MSKKTTYDLFENLIKDKLEGLESDYGKDWNKISSKLDGTKIKSSKNKNSLLVFISVLVGIGLLTAFLLDNNPENIKTIPKEIKINKPVVKIKPSENTINRQEKINKTKFSEIKESNNLSNEIYQEFDNINSEINDTNTFVSPIDSIADSSSSFLTENESVITNHISIQTNKAAVCYNDSITLSSSGCDSCLVLWKINELEYIREKKIKLLAKENLTVLLYEYTKQDSFLSLKDSLQIPTHKAPKIEIIHETTNDNGSISTYLTPIVVDEFSSVNYSFIKDGRFSWNFGDGSYSNQSHPRHEYKTNGKYMVYLSYEGHFGCTSYANTEVDITANFDILAPNTFTPNGDGINDVFMPEGLKLSGLPFEMVIFNKYGKTIFSTQNSNNGWTGFDQNTGRKCPTGNYLWVVRLENEDGTFNPYKGSVLIVD